MILKNLKKNYQAKKIFYSCLTKGKGNDEEYEYVLDLCNKFEMKTMEDCISNVTLYFQSMYLKNLKIITLF